VERVVFTDGACKGNPGPGGWAWAINDEHFASGFGGDTTNQRMELTAAWRAVEALDGAIEVRSDSTYVVNCFNQQWHVGWRRRGWRNSQKQAVANRDLWEPFIDLVLGRNDVRFTWVKGHSGVPMNEFVDQLAVAASGGQGRYVVPDPVASTELIAPVADRDSAGGDRSGGDVDDVIEQHSLF